MRQWTLLFVLAGLLLAGCVQPAAAPTATPAVGLGAPAAQQGFTGAVLAGNSSKIYDFNKADYDKALQTNKLVVLYFYANWCPVCRAEVPNLYAAFNELNTDKVIGFRVNFNDNETDDDEVALAREFGIAYQHTKIFLKNRQRVLKSLETWEKERYLTEINKALAG